MSGRTGIMRARPTTLIGSLLLAGSVLVCGACGMLRKPDMSHTTGIARLNKPQHPLILIHGFIGSKLRDRNTHKVVWGTMSNVLLGGDSDDLALPLDEGQGASEDALEAYAIY